MFKNFLELITEFSKVGRQKINLQESTIFLCISNEYMQTKFRNIIPLTATQNMKYLHDLTKYLYSLYAETHTALMKEVKEDLNRSRHILCSGIGRLNMVRTPVIFKLIYRFNTIPFKIPAKVFIDINEVFLRFI